MTVNAKEMIKALKLKGESENGRFSLYLNKKDWKEFQEICRKEGVSASAVIGKFMRDFSESAKGKK
jgi:hypothetical protein